MPVFSLPKGLEIEARRGSGTFGSDNVVGEIRMKGVGRPGVPTAGVAIRPPFTVSLRNATKNRGGAFTTIDGVAGKFDEDLDVSVGDTIEIVVSQPGMKPQNFSFVAV